MLTYSFGLAIFFYILELLFVYLNKIALKAYFKGKEDNKKINNIAYLASARIVGSLHNLVQIPIGIYILLNKDFRNDRVHHTSDLSYFMTIVSSGYFLYDMFICIKRFHLEGPAYTIHAVMCFTSYIYGGCTGLIHYHGAAFLMWETSTPFVHLRWIMYKLKLDHTKVYAINGACMVISFFLARIVWGYYSCYILVSDIVLEQLKPVKSFPIVATVIYCFATVVMSALNTVWFYKMAKKATDVLFKGKKFTEIGNDKDE